MPNAHDLAAKVQQMLPGSDAARPARDALDNLTNRAAWFDHLSDQLARLGPLADQLDRIRNDLKSLARKADATERVADEAKRLADAHETNIGFANDFRAETNARLAALEAKKPKAK
jgi:hypothetical protein